jgi:hypothetical protein
VLDEKDNVLEVETTQASGGRFENRRRMAPRSHEEHEERLEFKRGLGMLPEHCS